MAREFQKLEESQKVEKEALEDNAIKEESHLDMAIADKFEEIIRDKEDDDNVEKPTAAKLETETKVEENNPSKNDSNVIEAKTDTDNKV